MRNLLRERRTEKKRRGKVIIKCLVGRPTKVGKSCQSARRVYLDQHGAAREKKGLCGDRKYKNPLILRSSEEKKRTQEREKKH